MTQQFINIGNTANDGTGDPLRTAFTKCNQNFAELYAKGAAGSNLDLSDNDITATNTNGNVRLVPTGSGGVIIVDDNIRIQNGRAPASSKGQPGDVAGMITWSTSYIYVCTGTYDGSTDIWKRAAIGSTW